MQTLHIMLVFLLALTSSASAWAQGRTVAIDIGAIEEVTLGEAGERTIRFRTEHAGRLRYEIFAAPDAAGAVSMQFIPPDAEAEETSLPVIAPPGRYEARVRAANPGEALVQLRVWLDIPLDEFEDNNSRDTAHRIETPFAGLVHLAAGDRDWFRIDTRSGGILGVHMRTGSRYGGPRIAIYDHNGDQLFLSDDDQWGVAGMRYARTTGRTMYVEVWDTSTWNDNDSRVFKELIIQEYHPEGAPASNNALVTLSVEGDTSASYQLDLIGRAIGVNTVSADEADAVARELRVAIEGRSGIPWLWMLLLLVLLACGTGGYVYWRQQSKS